MCLQYPVPSTEKYSVYKMLIPESGAHPLRWEAVSFSFFQANAVCSLHIPKEQDGVHGIQYTIYCRVCCIWHTVEHLREILHMMLSFQQKRMLYMALCSQKE
jgi:hypothetical protein